MPRLICTSRYVKNSKSKNAGNLVKYMGTREGVEKLPNGYDNSPATQKQHSLICDLLRAYPPAWEYPEFEKYRVEQSNRTAHRRPYIAAKGAQTRSGAQIGLFEKPFVCSCLSSFRRAFKVKATVSV